MSAVASPADRGARKVLLQVAFGTTSRGTGAQRSGAGLWGPGTRASPPRDSGSSSVEGITDACTSQACPNASCSRGRRPARHLACSQPWRKSDPSHLVFGSLELHCSYHANADEVKLMDNFATVLHAQGMMALCKHARVPVCVQHT